MVLSGKHLQPGAWRQRRHRPALFWGRPGPESPCRPCPSPPKPRRRQSHPRRYCPSRRAAPPAFSSQGGTAGPSPGPSPARVLHQLRERRPASTAPCSKRCISSRQKSFIPFSSLTGENLCIKMIPANDLRGKVQFPDRQYSLRTESSLLRRTGAIPVPTVNPFFLLKKGGKSDDRRLLERRRCSRCISISSNRLPDRYGSGFFLPAGHPSGLLRTKIFPKGMVLCKRKPTFEKSP